MEGVLMNNERFDPADFPILGELEEEFARLVAERLEEDARAASRASAAPARWPESARVAPPKRTRRGEHLATGRRIARRAALVGALIGVVGASALAAKSVVSSRPSPNASVVLRHDAAHGVTLRRYHGRLCLDINYDGGVATHCTRAPDDPDGLAALSAITPSGRVVAGVAGPDVARVRVNADDRAATVPTSPAGDGDTRWFTATLATEPDRRRPTAAVLTALPSGTAAVDCSLGTAASCHAAMVRSGTLPTPHVNKP
jgi:hypothetical protein